MIFLTRVDDHLGGFLETEKFNCLDEDEESHEAEDSNAHGCADVGWLGQLARQVLVEVELFEAVARLRPFLFH